MGFAPCCSLSRIADTAAEREICVRMTLIELKYYNTFSAICTVIAICVTPWAPRWRMPATHRHGATGARNLTAEISFYGEPDSEEIHSSGLLDNRGCP